MQFMNGVDAMPAVHHKPPPIAKLWPILLGHIPMKWLHWFIAWNLRPSVLSKATALFDVKRKNPDRTANKAESG
jgi:hypothetical protein